MSIRPNTINPRSFGRYVFSNVMVTHPQGLECKKEASVTERESLCRDFLAARLCDSICSKIVSAMVIVGRYSTEHDRTPSWMTSNVERPSWRTKPISS